MSTRRKLLRGLQQFAMRSSVVLIGAGTMMQAIPANLTRLGLSQIINGLLALGASQDRLQMLLHVKLSGELLVLPCDAFIFKCCQTQSMSPLCRSPQAF